MGLEGGLGYLGATGQRWCERQDNHQQKSRFPQAHEVQHSLSQVGPGPIPPNPRRLQHVLPMRTGSGRAKAANCRNRPKLAEQTCTCMNSEQKRVDRAKATKWKWSPPRASVTSCRATTPDSAHGPEPGPPEEAGLGGSQANSSGHHFLVVRPRSITTTATGSADWRRD